MPQTLPRAVPDTVPGTVPGDVPETLPDTLAGAVPRTAPAGARLRPGTLVLDRGDGEVQLGTDPRWAVRLAGLEQAEVSWLLDLAERRHTTLAASAGRYGVAPARRDEIAAALARGAFLLPAPAPAPGRGRRPAPVLATADGAADSPALGALRPDGDGRATLVARGRRTVAVVGLGRLGAALALHLATAGVGVLLLQDGGPVQVTDLGLGGYGQRDVGAARRSALQRLLERDHPRTLVRDDAAPDLVVLVEDHVVRPARYARLVGEGVAHLPVVVREADVAVGPFVVPGATACARCADLHHADADPVWPALAAQLRDAPAPPQETTLAAVAAGAAAAQVLAHLDGLRPTTADAKLEVALPDAVPRVRPTPPHRRCGCTGPGPGAAALTPGR